MQGVVRATLRHVGSHFPVSLVIEPGCTTAYRIPMLLANGRVPGYS